MTSRYLGECLVLLIFRKVSFGALVGYHLMQLRWLSSRGPQMIGAGEGWGRGGRRSRLGGEFTEYLVSRSGVSSLQG